MMIIINTWQARRKLPGTIPCRTEATREAIRSGTPLVAPINTCALAQDRAFIIKTVLAPNRSAICPVNGLEHICRKA